MACTYERVTQIPTNSSGPYAYPDAHTDISNSKYAPQVTGNIINKIYSASRDELNSQFPTQSPYPYPALIISADPRRTAHNTGIYEYQSAHGMLVYNNDKACVEPFAVRNLNNAGSLQAGYAKNIDLDSELKRINHLTDKCYYDNYKSHPFEAPAGNGLYCNKNELVKDYSSIGKPNCIPRVPQLSAITPIYEQPATRADELYQSSNEVRYGQFKNPGAPNEFNGAGSACVGQIKPAPKCLPTWTAFNKCDTGIPDSAQCLISYKMSVAGNMPDHYKFNGDITAGNTLLSGAESSRERQIFEEVSQTDKKYNLDYPCQRLFNNSTKRSTLPNFQNTFDINPKFLN